MITAKKIERFKEKFTRDNIIYLVTMSFFFMLVLLSLLYQINIRDQRLEETNAQANQELVDLQQRFEEANVQLDVLMSEDQFLRNEALEKNIGNIETTYDSAVSAYEEILEIETKINDTKDLKILFADTLSLLSQREYQQAQERINKIRSDISQIEQDLAQQAQAVAEKPPADIPVNNTPPGSGYSRQVVATSDVGSFTVSIISADLSSTKVIVDTASSSDCTNDCPVLSLAEYVSRNGAYAGVNGSYFCPASYPSCAGKTNTFDLLIMNRDKTYFNSNNNVYSNNPAVIFGDSYIRFVSAVSQWGRDTSPNGVLSNYPLLVANSSVVFGGDDDPKKGSKGNRSFVANKGNTVYIGAVHSATVAESARALNALGMENALNLDSGGSTALWHGGYKLGPGRNIPNAILFVSK